MKKMILLLTLFASLTGESRMNPKDQSIVNIAASAATGKMDTLSTAFTAGLDAGLTINEIKEILVQLYAYAGFPRSLNALAAFSDALEARKKNGIDDAVGASADPLPPDADRTVLGGEIRSRLTGTPLSAPPQAYQQFAPVIDQFLKEHLFADVFSRGILTFRQREIATISMLAAMEGVGDQLAAHIKIGMNTGLSQEEIAAILATASKTIRTPAEALFPKGEKLPETWFTGTAWLYMLASDENNLNCSIGNVTFEPGARNHWHIHKIGQILLVTAGKGYYQERGKPAQRIKKGDVVVIPKGVEHWHGAARDSSFTHLAITQGETEWLARVGDEELPHSE